MPDVIVNADDYGLTDGVNRAIEDSHAEGMLTSTTVLVTGASAGATSDLPRRFPGLDVGLHVNLTLGSPASDPGAVPSLVDADGILLSEAELLRRLVRRQVQSSEVHSEALAQARRLQGLGVAPTHWDGHRGVAFWPLLVGPVANAMREAGIRAVRSQRVWIVGPGSSPAMTRWRWRLSRPRRLLGDAARRRAARRVARHFRSPGWRLSAGGVLGEMDYETRWRRAFEGVPGTSCELVIHPGYPDAELAAITPGLSTEREIDLRVLLDRSFREQLVARGIRFVGFRDLLPK